MDFVINVDSRRMMDSIERAYLKVTSPTGRSVFIRKVILDKTNYEEKKLFYRICGDPTDLFKGERQVTRNEMSVILKLSEL